MKHMKVSWDYYSQYMEKKNMFQNTNQILMNKYNTLYRIVEVVVLFSGIELSYQE